MAGGIPELLVLLVVLVLVLVRRVLGVAGVLVWVIGDGVDTQTLKC